ncbi:hypothetical protein JMM81_07590 [Bacillus sp. V3B]|uniref:hypothetical protein n=1 Tax=Bacillus sp. V3B TaxID=2804915 RepID=UPI00210BBA78|nr:hypothetical protein [Bacillus sp. V3B]MCQ6274832.1 hypothetical protein [Bacillus sp. V3B]
MEEPINNSKGFGGVMRVGPVGFFWNDSNQYTFLHTEFLSPWCNIYVKSYVHI